MTNIEKKRRLLAILDEITLSSDDIENSYQHYSNLKRNYELEFENKTKLNELDIKILFLGVFLQIARQFFISNNSFRFKSATDGDKIPDTIAKKISSNLGHERYIKILTGSVPYDAVNYLDKENFSSMYGSHGISGTNHRYTTLGHDPILGWIFGTMNIMTETLTKNNLLLESYTVKNNKIDAPISIVNIFENTFKEIEQDYLILGVSIVKQALHFSSDCFTKMGLPIPMINTFSPKLTKELLSNKYNIDFYSVSRGILFSNIINYIIGVIHQLYCNDSINQKLYDVKTKKVILYSNMIASTSNVIYTAITKDFRKLDVGGFIVTLFNLYKSQKFIREIKEEYFNGKLDGYYENEIKKLDMELDTLLYKILK